MEQLLIKYCFSEKEPEIQNFTSIEEYYSAVIYGLESEGIIKDIVTHEWDNPFRDKKVINYTTEGWGTYVYGFSCNETRNGITLAFKFNVKFTYETYNTAEILYIDIYSNNYAFTTKSESNCLEILKHQLRKKLIGWKNRYCLLDKQSVFYASELYPKIHETENFFRYYVNDVFIKIFGNNWWNEAVASSIKKSREQRIIDTREYSGANKDIQPYLMSLEWNDLMQLATTKTFKWIPTYDAQIEKVLNKYSNTEIISLLKQQCQPHIDIWEMCFSKHFDKDFSEKYHILEKRRNQIAHNKLLDFESYNVILSLCETVMDGLAKAHKKFCEEFISEEEQEIIEEYKMDLLQQKEMEGNAIDAIAEEESGVKVYSHVQIAELYSDIMSNLYIEIKQSFDEREDIEFSEYIYLEDRYERQCCFTIVNKINDKIISIFADTCIDDSQGQSSILKVYCELEDKSNISKIGFINGEYSFNDEQTCYMPETQDELDDQGIEKCKEMVCDFIDKFFPNLREEADLYNHLEAMGKDSSITERDLFCCECGQEYICNNNEYAPIGMCLNCATMNYIVYCTYCNCPIEAIDIEVKGDEKQNYCISCNDKLFGND